jgi:hypothetical protein
MAKHVKYATDERSDYLADGVAYLDLKPDGCSYATSSRHVCQLECFQSYVWVTRNDVWLHLDAF